MKTDLSIRACIYLRAAELVEQGHCKYVLWERNDAGEKVAFCYRGALIEAEAEITGLCDDSWKLLAWRAPEKLVDWNNRPSTTKEMVAAKLREQAFEEGV